jgi:hypothetical protein
MLPFFRKLFGETPAPLKGVPKIRREKTHSAETGYVYQYFYTGYRETTFNGDDGCEHLFDVSSDRSSRFTIRMFLGRQALDPWEKANGRELTATEQYALVKLSLFQAFDERTDFDGDNAVVVVRPEQVEEHVSTLDL